MHELITAVDDKQYQQAVREAATICPRPCKLTFDLLTLKVVSESHVMWATSVPILVFLGLFVLELGQMYAIDVRQTSDAHHRLMPHTLVAGHNKLCRRPSRYASLTSHTGPTLTVSHGSAYTLVRATQQVHGKMAIFGC